VILRGDRTAGRHGALRRGWGRAAFVALPLSLAAPFTLVLGACEGGGGEPATPNARDRGGPATRARLPAAPLGSTGASATGPSPAPVLVELPPAQTAGARFGEAPDASISQTQNPSSESRGASLDSVLVSCPAVPGTPYTDCECPEGSAAIGGGAYAPGKLVLKESRPLSAIAWRIACQAADGTQGACAAGEPGAVWIVCGRVNAAR
jgi:hypothetical protein